MIKAKEEIANCNRGAPNKFLHCSLTKKTLAKIKLQSMKECRSINNWLRLAMVSFLLADDVPDLPREQTSEDLAKPITIRVSYNLRRAIDQYTTQNDLSYTEFVRQAVAYYLNQK